MRQSKPMDRLKAKVAPEHTALVLVDMQRDYCCDGGIIDRMGFCLDAPKALVGRLQAFLDEARKTLRHIIHLKMTHLPEVLSPALVEHYERAGMLHKRDPSYSEFHQITPLEGEVVLPKYRYSGFVSTYLDQHLRMNGIETLVVTGLATNVCVESTVRDGFMRDYRIVVPHDLTEGTTPEAKEASLWNIAKFFGEVVNSADLLQCWRT